MISIAESNLRQDQTIVVIGGNSIFYGFGQGVSELWSDELQRLLGSRYKIVNFAMPASEPFEGAYCAAESLLKKGRKVIYLADAGPAQTDYPEGSPVYGYSYWDAREKRLLTHDKDRDALIESRIRGHQSQRRERINELRMRMQLDSLFYFEDLWTAVAYCNFFTVWTEFTTAHPCLARKYYAGEAYVGYEWRQREQAEPEGVAKDAYNACFEPETAKPN